MKTLPGTASNGTVNVNPADPTGYVLTGISTQVVHSDDHEYGIGANFAMPTRFNPARGIRRCRGGWKHLGRSRWQRARCCA